MVSVWGGCVGLFMMLGGCVAQFGYRCGVSVFEVMCSFGSGWLFGRSAVSAWVGVGWGGCG